MNKTQFTSELKELMSAMTAEEIERTIEALSGCKAAVKQNDDRNKSEKAWTFRGARGHAAELRFVAQGESGTLHTVGASLPDEHCYHMHQWNLPQTDDFWWLDDGSLVTDKGIKRWYDRKTLMGHVRPVLLIDRIDGKLKPGDFFRANGEAFRLLTPLLAIRTECLEGECTYRDQNHHEPTIVQYCLEGWYESMIRNHSAQDAADETTKGHVKS